MNRADISRITRGRLVSWGDRLIEAKAPPLACVGRGGDGQLHVLTDADGPSDAEVAEVLRAAADELERGA